MQKFNRQIVIDVLAANDIVDVVGGVVELKPAGTARLKACCPFHTEKTPSFTVSRDRQMFYCFGCGKHGDAISFLCEYEGLTFSEALRKLADRAGIRLPAMTEKDSRDDFVRTQLIEFGKMARSFFREMLNDPLKGSACRHYLKGRDLKPETVQQFGLGYAPDTWSALVDKARAAGFKESIVEASGLARRGERGSLYDFFRNRLMIPILDVSGNVVAFGGRDLGDGIPKYINSPENALYKKGRVLYGLYEAREAMRREQRVILVEGYFDLLRCFDAGVKNVLASCGTALTPEQAGLIHRYVREVVVVFDADAAGVKAALRGIGLLTEVGLSVRAMALPDGKDPDDYVKAHGAQAFTDLVDDAPDFVTFYVRMSSDRTQTIEGRSAVAQEIFSMLTGLKDEIRREEYLKRAARELGLHVWTLRDEFARYARESAAGQQLRPKVETIKAKPIGQDDQDFVAVLLTHNEYLQKTKSDLAGVSLPPGPLTEVLQAMFLGVDLDLAQRLDTDEARALYAAASAGQDVAGDKASELVEKRVARLRIDALKAEGDQVQRELQEAERSNDQPRVMELLQRKVGIRKKIESLGAA